MIVTVDPSVFVKVKSPAAKVPPVKKTSVYPVVKPDTSTVCPEVLVNVTTPVLGL